MESLSAAGGVGSRDFVADYAMDLESDPAIMAFSDLMVTSLARVSSAAENIGDKVLEATKILEAAFAALKELLIKVKQSPLFKISEDVENGWGGEGSQISIQKSCTIKFL